MSDVKVENHGSVFLLRVMSTAAGEWCDANIAEDGQWLGDALAVEPRYVEAVVEGMRGDGLEVE